MRKHNAKFQKHWDTMVKELSGVVPTDPETVMIVAEFFYLQGKADQFVSNLSSVDSDSASTEPVPGQLALLFQEGES